VLKNAYIEEFYLFVFFIDAQILLFKSKMMRLFRVFNWLRNEGNSSFGFSYPGWLGKRTG
jgi:hypothetical protein